MLIYGQNGYRVFKTDTFRCSCYIISYDKKNIIIDTSMKFERSALLKSMQKANLNKLDAIFLTHSHTDHAANAKYLSDIYHCPVYVSEKGLENVKNGVCTMPGGTLPYSKFICAIERKVSFYDFKKFESCPHAELLTPDIASRYLGSHAKLINTPGHSDDSISIILDDRIIFLGDSAVNVFGNKVIVLYSGVKSVA